MGYYIECEKHLGKANQLVEKYGAIRLSKRPENFSDVPETTAIVVVLENGLFDAAGYCYDEREMLAFDSPRDYRKKHWLLMDKDLVNKLTGFDPSEH